MSIGFVATPNAPRAIGPYSQATRAGDFLFTAGQVGFDPATGEEFGDDTPQSIWEKVSTTHPGRTVTVGFQVAKPANLKWSEILTNLNREDLTTTDGMGNKVDGGPLKDTRVNSKVAISAKIGINLAFQTSLELHYDNRPGPLPIKDLADNFQPEASSIDTIMKVSFIYTFVGATPPDKK